MEFNHYEDFNCELRDILKCSQNYIKGERGKRGPKGATGSTGNPGQNQTAFIGPTGPTGITGDSGTIGSTGPTGPIGDSGHIGSTGPMGIIGITGPTGPVTFGVTGAIGATGQTGPFTSIQSTGFSAVLQGESTPVIPAGTTSKILTGWLYPPYFISNSDFDSSSGVYTVPSDGIYHISAVITSSFDSSLSQYIDENMVPSFEILRNGVSFSYPLISQLPIASFSASTETFIFLNGGQSVISSVELLNAGDTISLRYVCENSMQIPITLYGPSATFSGNRGTFFNIFKII